MQESPFCLDCPATSSCLSLSGRTPFELVCEGLARLDPAYKYLLPGGAEIKNLPVNAGDTRDAGSVPDLGRSPGVGNGNPLPYSWAYLVTQLVKNLPAMRETLVQSLGWEDPLEQGMAIHSSILAWIIPRDRGVWWAIVHDIKSQT